MFMAGASAVQVCTEAILRGPNVYGKIVSELNHFLDSHGYTTIDAIQGLAIRKQAERRVTSAPAVPLVDQQKCVLCGMCKVSCAYGAISQQNELHIDGEKCFGCGLCVTRCKQRALRLPDGQ
jgi:Pyruvate/2-oxoacid:ferredoxin oxidoreductase delta subunit